MAVRRRGDLEFGSDSFLDIIANIVGILIILIVVAGLRASREPVDPAEPVATVNLPAKETPVEPVLPPLVAPRKVMQLEPLAPLLALPTAPVPGQRPEIDTKLPGQIANAQSELATMQSLHAQFRTQLQAARKEIKSVKRSNATAENSLQSVWTGRKQTAAAMNRLRQSLKRNTQTLAALQRQYDEAKRKGVRAKQVIHKLTPVGTEVAGNELHFRLARGRIAMVPLKELVDLLKRDVVRRKDWLIKVPVHRGTVGPVRGFIMKYVVERKQQSVLDEVRSGYGRVRIVLAGWKIEPTPKLNSESVEEALQVGSRFQRAVQFAATGTTLTFWVYPDSFGLYRQLLKAARQSGLRVAARPLPFGMPIAGSPRGSKSVGQ